MSRRFFARVLAAIGLGSAAKPTPGRAASSMDYERASEIVTELATHLVSLTQRLEPNWSEAFWRFESEETRYGSNGSYASPDGVELLDAIEHRDVLKAMSELGRKLWLAEREPGKRFCVCLLAANANLDYKIYFERQDMSKWRITKLDGASGRPAGFDAQQAVQPDRHEDAAPG